MKASADLHAPLQVSGRPATPEALRFRRRSMLSLLCGCLPLQGMASSEARLGNGFNWTRLVVPSTQGSVSFKLAHALAAAWPAIAGHPLVAIERAGAAGTLALHEIARGPADGSMLLLGNTGTHVVRPEVAPTSGIAMVRPLAKLASAPGVLVGTADLPADTLTGLVQLVRNRPGQLSFASAGIGSLGHLVMESICMHTSMALLHVPYKSSTESLSDLLAGRIHLNILSVGAALALLQRGRLKAYAFSGIHRSPQLAEIPTFRELGFGGAEIESWQGLFVRTDIPLEKQLRLEVVVAGVLKDASFRQTLHSEHLDIAMPASLGAFSQTIEAQRLQVRTLIRAQRLRLL